MSRSHHLPDYDEICGRATHRLKQGLRELSTQWPRWGPHRLDPVQRRKLRRAAKYTAKALDILNQPTDTE